MTYTRPDPFFRRTGCPVLLLLTLLAALGCGGNGGSAESTAGAAGDPASESAVGSGFNILLISLDTTRADHLGCYGHRESPTPNIDRLADEGTLFEQCVAPTPITLPSHASLMTAVDPFVHGVRYNGAFRLADEHRTLAEALQERGYATAAELGSYVLNSEFGLHQGFERYHDLRERRTQRSAEEVADDAIARLREAAGSGRPFFLFAHFFDPHQPYEAPAPFSGKYSTPYLDEMAYMDAHVGRLLAELDALGVRDRTLVVLTGDHGESLGEHGEDTHSFFVYDSTMAVPLIVRAPERIAAGRRVGAQVRLIDIAPTILAFVGGETIAHAQGVSLLPVLGGAELAADRAAYGETLYPRFAFGYSPLRSWRAERWKYIHAPTPELYDLESDPGELTNLASRETERVERMREQMRAWIAQAPTVDTADGAEREVSDEEWAKLEALGYVGGSAANVTAASELEMFEPEGADPKDRLEVMSLSAKALALQRKGEYEEAERLLRRLFDSAEEEGSELAVVHDLYAKVLVATGRYEEAIEQFLVTIRSGRAAGEARTNLGAALLRVGRADEALLVLEDALRHEPVFASTHANYASALVAQKRFDEAMRQFRQALEIDPGMLDAHVGLAATLAAAKQPDASIAAYRKAIEFHPDAVLPRRLLGEMLIGLNRPQEALEQYQGLIQVAPDDARVNRGLGLVYFQLKQLVPAMTYLGRAVELDPESARAWYTFSGAQAMSGKLPDAIESARRALALAVKQGQNDFAERIRSRIQEYERAGG